MTGIDAPPDAAHRYHRDQALRVVNDTVAFAAAAVPAESLVLDVGAADGSVAGVLRAAGSRVVGVEPDPVAAAEAEAVCERVIVADVERLDPADLGGPYDAILVLDVLEHLHDPVRVLQTLRPLLADRGRLVVSVPNGAHAAVRLAVLDNRFDYRDLGLLDRTHLRFFDHDGFLGLLQEGGFEPVFESGVWREFDETELGGADVLARHPELVEHLDADPHAATYQFLAVAAPVGSALLDDPGLEPSLLFHRRATELERALHRRNRFG